MGLKLHGFEDFWFRVLEMSYKIDLKLRTTGELIPI